MSDGLGKNELAVRVPSRPASPWLRFKTQRGYELVLCAIRCVGAVLRSYLVVDE